MYKLAMTALLSIVVTVGVSRADVGEPDQHPGHQQSPGYPNPGNDCHGDHCKPPTREVCFNLLCMYQEKGHSDQQQDDGQFRSCRAAATFTGLVTKDGGEFQQDSNFDDQVRLELKCDDRLLYNGGARRLADLLGTRIEGNAGPFPALTLPRGALHTGPNGQSGDHVSKSTLHVDLGDIQKLHGKCFIWTGRP